MARKTLKLAIMGASGVGKSVFLASYFNCATNKDEGNLAIRFADSESIDHVSEMIQTLFIEHKPISGTDKRYNMSFHVTNPDCLISLHDIPGGWTTSAKSWEDAAVNIYNDLKNADGVIFFVSVGDLDPLHPETYDIQNYKDMSTFSMALDLLRKPKDDSASRQDVPVCVVFTKGDLNPGTTLEELEGEYRNFLKSAQDEGGKFKWFKVGHNVKCWKSVAMGRWEKQDQPPVEGEHQNVIEPMEWLVERMNSAKSAHIKRWVLLFASIFVVFSGVIIGWDHYSWHSTKKDILQLTAANRYDEAEATLTEFENRLFFASILPDFLEAGADVPDIKASLQAKSAIYEKNRLKDTANKHFEELGSYIKGADWSQYPQAKLSYYAEGVKSLQKYIDRTEYYQVTPDKYDKVKEVLPYWIVCRELRSVDVGTDNSELTGDDAFIRLENILKSDTGIPLEWKERQNPKIHGLMLFWLNSMPVPETPEMATQLIGKGNILIHYSRLPQESSQVLNGKITEWKQAEFQLWEPTCNQWLREAADKDPGDAIVFLSEKRTQPNLPDQFRQTIDAAVQSHWQRRFNLWAEEVSSYNPQEAYTFLENQLTMAQLPQDIREKLDVKLHQLWEPICNQWLREAADNEPSDAIAFLSEKRTQPNLPDQFWQTIDVAIQSHWQRRFNLWAEEASSYNPQEAYTFLENQLTMTQLPQDIREGLDEKLRYYEDKIIEVKMDEIRVKASNARNLMELTDLLPILNTLGNDYPSAVSAGNNVLAERLNELVQNEFSILGSKFGNYLVAEDFDRARETMKEDANEIKAGLERFRGKNIDIAGNDRQLAQIRADMMRRLEEGEFAASKKAFSRLKNESMPSTYEIDTVLKILEHFLSTYPGSDKNSQVMQVKEYLSAVSNGIRGYIIIKNSNCRDRLYGDNEFVVTLRTSNGKNWESRELEGDDINWNERVSIRWTPSTTVYFQLIEKDIKYDDEFLNETVFADGIFGYKKLMNCWLQGDKKGCSLSITAEFDPPHLSSGWE